MAVYKFRNCLLNADERSLLIDFQPIDLTTKSLDLLQFLVERAGDVLSKDELLGKVWDGSFVEESNLPVHISKLRRSLGESKNNRFIETVQGTGYRFLPRVTPVSHAEWSQTLATGHAPGSSNCIDSIAVLPLKNESQDPKSDYIADGLTESLINALSRMPGVRVIARDAVFKYRQKKVEIPALARALNVQKILTGRIRVTRDEITISLELIDALEGRHLWGEKYQRPFAEILKMQHQVVENVAEIVVRQAFSRDLLTVARTENPEYYRLYLKGIHFLAKRTPPAVFRAIDYFEKSISRSRTNISSYVGLVEANRYLYMSDCISRKAAVKRISPLVKKLERVDDSVDTVQLILGKIDFQLYWRFESAEAYFRRALTLNPNFVDAHSFYADIMLALGRTREAIFHCDRILALDPISLLSYKRVGRVLYGMGDYSEAFRVLRDAYEMEPDDFETLVLLGAVATELNDFGAAMRFLRKSYSYQKNPDTLAMMGYVHALREKRDDAIKIIRQIREEFPNINGNSIKIARIYVALDDFEKAYLFLERAFREHEVDLYALAYDPRWRKLEHEVRFQKIIRRVMYGSSDLEEE